MDATRERGCTFPSCGRIGGKKKRSRTMIGLRCLHGMDTRFCSLCNRPRTVEKPTARRGQVADVSLAEIIRFLNHEQVRATYRAVAGVLGVIPRTVGAKLGPRCVEASWIVSTATGLPTDYDQDEMHPALLHKIEIIATGRELTRRMSAWKAGRTRAAAGNPVDAEGQS
jgi:hypothetical protein